MPDDTTTFSPRAAATRQRILDAALAEFAAKGLAGARVDEIAARAGANKRMLYAYYGDKDALFEAVLDWCWTAFNEAVPFDAADLAGPAAAAATRLPAARS